MEYRKVILPFEKYHLPEKRLPFALPPIVKEFNYQVISGVYRPYWNKCLCGNKEFDLVASVDKSGFIAPLAMCRKCGMLMVNPRYSEVFYQDLRMHKHYFLTFYGYDQPKEYALAKFNPLEGSDIFNLVKHGINIDTQTTVVEISSGAGWNLIPFINKGAKVKGFEDDKTFVEIGQSLGMDIEHLPVNNLSEVDQAFDIVIMSGVLNRMFSPIDVLKKALTLVKDTGIIYIDVPRLNYKTLDFRLDWFYYFSVDAFRFFIAEAGLKPLEVRLLDDRIAGVFRKEDFQNSKYLLTRSRIQTYKSLKRLRRREVWRFSKKIKDLNDVPIFKILDKID